MRTTRIATEDDEQFLYELYVSTREEEVGAYGWEEEEVRAFLKMQWMMQQSPINWNFHMQYS